MSPAPALAGLRVIDMSTVLAGPNCARYLADFGADVIKVERPGGDSLRNMAWRDPRDGEGLWWKLVNRNKRTVVLDVKDSADRDVLLSLIDDGHVLVENSRPGTMERLGLGPDVLLERNPDLVMTRVSGFGQDGPYASRPGFATIAEAMSGLAALSGEPDGQPLLPPIALTDELTGLAAAFATMVALHSGVGQVVDANLLETMFQMMGPLASVYAVRGEQQPRLGAGLPYTVPRGTYRCADDRWVAVSTSSDSVAARVMEVLGVGDDDRFTTFAGRTEHRNELEQIMTDWCLARTQADVIDAFTTAEAAIGPVYDMADIANDPHYAARGAIADVDGTPMQGLIARLSATPGELRWSGTSIGRRRRRHPSLGLDLTLRSPFTGRSRDVETPCTCKGFLVREGGLEPPRPFGHQHLKLARLPFRHSRKWSTNVSALLDAWHARSAPPPERPPMSEATGYGGLAHHKPVRTPTDERSDRMRRFGSSRRPTLTGWSDGAGTNEGSSLASHLWDCSHWSTVWSVWSMACSFVAPRARSVPSNSADVSYARWTTNARSTSRVAASSPTTSRWC